MNLDNVPFFFSSESLFTNAAVLKNRVSIPFLQASTPRAIDKCVLPVCKILHTGKTHLSIALGVEACKKGIETRFFRTAALVNRLSEEKKKGTLSKFMKQILKSELLILDEWGYVPLDRLGAQLLFEIISECYERKSLIINTNIEFSRWVTVFYDEQMTSAIVDRVLHHCHLLLFPGQSNRIKESGLGK